MKSNIGNHSHGKKVLLKRTMSIFIVFLLLIQITSIIPVEATSKMKMNKSSITLYLNEDNSTNTSDTYDFSIKNKPASYKTKYTFKWYTENTDIITVAKGGVVTAKKVGTATVKCDITKKSNKKLYTTATAKVTVKANAETVTITNCPENNEMAINSEFDFNRTMKAANGGAATDKTLWESSDESIISIDSKGLAKALKAGTATVQAKTYQSKSTKDQITAESEPIEIKVLNTISEVSLISNNKLKVSFSDTIDQSQSLKPTDFNITNTSTSVRSYLKDITLLSDKKSILVETYDNLVSGVTYKVNIKGSYEKSIDVVYGDHASINLKGYSNVEGNKVLIDGTIFDANGVDVTSKYRDYVYFNESYLGTRWVNVIDEHDIPDDLSSINENAKYYPEASAAPINSNSLAFNIDKSGTKSLLKNITVNDITYGSSSEIISNPDNLTNLECNYYEINSDGIPIDDSEVISDCKVSNNTAPTKPGSYAVTITCKSDSLNLMETKEYTFKINKKEHKINITDVKIGDIKDGSYTIIPIYTADGTPTFTYTAVDGEINESSYPCKPGTYKVNAVIPESEFYKECTADYEFTIPESDATLKIEDSSKDDSDEDMAAASLNVDNSSDNPDIDPSKLLPDSSKEISIGLINIYNRESITLNKNLVISPSTNAGMMLPQDCRINFTSMVIGGTLEIAGGSFSCSNMEVSSGNSLYLDDTKLLPVSASQDSLIRTIENGHVVFSSLKEGSSVKVQMDGNNDLLEISSEDAPMAAINGQQCSAVLTDEDNNKINYYGSLERVLEEVISKLDENGSSAEVTLLENATITKDTVIPANLKLNIKDGVKLTVADGVKLTGADEKKPAEAVGEKQTSETQNKTLPQTGDNSTVKLWIAALLLCGSITGTIGIIKTKKQYR